MEAATKHMRGFWAAFNGGRTFFLQVLRWTRETIVNVRIVTKILACFFLRVASGQTTAQREWVDSYLNAHPGAAATVIPLTERAFVISVTEGETGSVFAVAGNASGLGVVWRLQDWGIAVSAKIQKLAESSQGHPRFYVDASEVTPMGSTIPAQLSIWEWDGSAVKPLLERNYQYELGSRSVALQGDTLRIRTKERFQTLLTCGACPVPAAEWTIHIGADRVEDLGRRRLEPELYAIDELFFRLSTHASTADIAAPRVAAVVGQALRDLQLDAVSPIGTLGDWKIEPRTGGARVCLCTDGGELRYIFTLLRSREKLFVQDAVSLPDGKSCARQ